jgi:hypothetical protein
MTSGSSGSAENQEFHDGRMLTPVRSRIIPAHDAFPWPALAVVLGCSAHAQALTIGAPSVVPVTSAQVPSPVGVRDGDIEGQHADD